MCLCCGDCCTDLRNKLKGRPERSVYDFVVTDGKGQAYPLSQHRGKAMMIVNVASACGYTESGYTTATTLYDKYKNCGFIVIAFPCNQFAMQERGNQEEIQHFACTRFKADFPIMKKTEVNGSDAEPLYVFLKAALPGCCGTSSIKWNFTMFLVDASGDPVARFSPKATTEEIEKALIPLLPGYGTQPDSAANSSLMS